MRIKCMDCGKKFRTQGACTMHGRDKHPHLVHARQQAASRPARKARSSGWITSVAGGFLGAAAFMVMAIAIAVNGRALEVSPQGVFLKPLVTVTTPTARR